MNARTAPRRPKAALAALLIALPLILAGCGNKGPLILPPKDIPVDPSTLPPSTDNPNFAMPPAETDDTQPVDDTTVPAQPTEPAQPTKPTDDPAKGDDDGGGR